MRMKIADIETWQKTAAIRFEQALKEHGLERAEDARDVEVEIALTKMQVEKETLAKVLGIEEA